MIEVLIWLLILLLVAVVAFYIINHAIPAGSTRTIALAITGVILLIVLLTYILPRAGLPPV